MAKSTHLVEREEEIDDLSLAIGVLNHSRVLKMIPCVDLIREDGPQLTRMRIIFGCLDFHPNPD